MSTKGSSAVIFREFPPAQWWQFFPPFRVLQFQQKGVLRSFSRVPARAVVVVFPHHSGLFPQKCTGLLTAYR